MIVYALSKWWKQYASKIFPIREKHQNSHTEDFFVNLYLQFDILGFYKEIKPTRDFYGKSTFFPSNQRYVNKDLDFTEKFWAWSHSTLEITAKFSWKQRCYYRSYKGLISREKFRWEIISRFSQCAFGAFYFGTVWSLRVCGNFVPLFLIKNSVQSTCFLNCFPVNWFHEWIFLVLQKFFISPHCVWVFLSYWQTQCRKTRHLLSLKNYSVKSNL